MRRRPSACPFEASGTASAEEIAAGRQASLAEFAPDVAGSPDAD